MAANPEEKQDLIRQAAIRIFSHKGFYNTCAEEIAREAGIAVGTIYNYFQSKEHSAKQPDLQILIGITGPNKHPQNHRPEKRHLKLLDWSPSL